MPSKKTYGSGAAKGGSKGSTPNSGKKGLPNKAVHNVASRKKR